MPPLSHLYLTVGCHLPGAWYLVGNPVEPPLCYVRCTYGQSPSKSNRQTLVHLSQEHSRPSGPARLQTRERKTGTKDVTGVTNDPGPRYDLIPRNAAARSLAVHPNSHITIVGAPCDTPDYIPRVFLLKRRCEAHRERRNNTHGIR